MRYQTLAVVTVILAIGGHFAQHPGDMPGVVKVVVGGTAYAIGLAIIGMVDEGLAMGFAVLVLITALMFYGPALSKKLGFLGGL